MRLDFNPDKGYYILHGTDDATKVAAREAGFDWSIPAAVWYTGCPYAALHFWSVATPAAQDALFWLKLAYDVSWQADYEGSNLTAPPGLEHNPFQKAGIRYAAGHANALIGDDMGLGKTVQAIGVASECQMERVLVIAPAAARFQWAREIKKWYVHPKGKHPVTYVVTKSKDGIHPGAHWVILSYDLARGDPLHHELLRGRFDMIVLDEGHMLKSYEAKRTRAVFGANTDPPTHPLADRADKLVALTGTPLPNRPRECYTLARGLDWDSIDRMSEEAFRARYNPSLTVDEKTIEKTGRLPELHNRLRCNFMVRRLKRDVLHQLPACRYELVYIEENAEIKRAVQAENLLGIDPLQLGRWQGSGDDEAIATVRRQMGEAKVPRVIERTKQLMDGGLEKMGLFVWHRSVLDELAEKLSSFGVAVVDGRCTALQKDRNKQRFIEDPNCRIFLGQILAAGTALDGMQRVCSWVDIAEPSWVPGDNEQIVDRFWRMEQRNAVQANLLVAPGSFDERILSVNLFKTEDKSIVLDNRTRER